MFKLNYYLLKILIFSWIIYLSESKYEDTNGMKPATPDKFRRIQYPSITAPSNYSLPRYNSGTISSNGNIGGNIGGSIGINIRGNVGGNIGDNIDGNIGGNFGGTIGSSTTSSSFYIKKIMQSPYGTGSNNMDLCAQDRNRKLLCYCLPNDLTKNGEVTRVDCWVYQKNLYRNDTIWIAFTQKQTLKHIKFTVQPTGHLDYIPTECLRQLNNLTTITIEFAQIPILRGYSFGNLPNLELVKLQHNGIQLLDQNAFVNHALLHELHLEYNNIYEIDRYSFRNLPKLKKLYMQSNNISQLPEQVFSELAKLEELNLGYNSISTLTLSMFLGLSNLKYLKFTRNNLICIKDTVFAELWSLEELELDDNNIEDIYERAFDGLNQLKVLNLRGNRLKTVDNGLLRGTPALLSVNLQENLLETLQVYSFEPIMDNLIHKASELLLTDNLFVCDCRLQWIIDLRNQTKNDKMKIALDEVECTMFDTKYQQYQTSSSANNIYLQNSKTVIPEPRKSYDKSTNNNEEPTDDNNDGNNNDNVKELVKLNADLLPCPAALKETTELPLPRESIRIPVEYEHEHEQPREQLRESSNCQSNLLNSILIKINLIILFIKYILPGRFR